MNSVELVLVETLLGTRGQVVAKDYPPCLAKVKSCIGCTGAAYQDFFGPRQWMACFGTVNKARIFRVGCFIDWVLCHPGTVMVTSRRIFIVSASSGTDCPSRPCPCVQSVLLGQRSSILLRICSALVMASVMAHSRAGHGLSPTSPVFPDSIEETPRSRWYFMLLFAVRTDNDVAALESTLDVLRMDYHVHPASTSQVVKNEFIFHNVAPWDPGQRVAHAACPMSSTPHPQKRGTVGQERKPAPKVPRTLGPWDSNVG